MYTKRRPSWRGVRKTQKDEQKGSAVEESEKEKESDPGGKKKTGRGVIWEKATKTHRNPS